MAARAQASGASSSRRLFVLAVLGGSNRQRKERAIGKFEIPAGHLYLTFPAWFAFDHELLPTGNRLGRRLEPYAMVTSCERRHPAISMCRSIDQLHARVCYPRYPQGCWPPRPALPGTGRADLAGACTT